MSHQNGTKKFGAPKKKENMEFWKSKKKNWTCIALVKSQLHHLPYFFPPTSAAMSGVAGWCSAVKTRLFTI